MQEPLLAAEGGPQLSQGARIVNIFVAPSKTFLDIRRNASWWLPCVLVALIGALTIGFSVKKIGAPEMGAQTLHHMPSLEGKVDSMAPDQAAKIRKSFEDRSKSNIYTVPITLLVCGFIAAGVFLLGAKFAFAGSASYGQMLAVFWYSLLPLLVMDLLIAVLLAANVGTENYNPMNPVGTNIGYYMDGGSAALTAFLAAIDLFSIWIFALQAIGISKTAGIKMSYSIGLLAVVWLVYIGLVKVLPMALFG